MKTSEFEILCEARCSLEILASGMRLSRTRVSDIASKIKAPKGRWRSKSLMKWIDEKMFLMNCNFC